MTLPSGSIRLLYDGDCPICNRYVTALRLRKSVGALQLLDARESSPERDRAEAAGLDINQGFVVMVDDELYFGHRSLQVLALMSSRSGVFNRLNYLVFRRETPARLLYPVLATGRILLLKLLGRRLIE